ncbi:MAG: GNAT family N-acetyltransferase [Planctomycetota bacterium]|jgi:putative hemolysin|nr:GNAT family N-acetyltransferase [Planctomycetota bacterium]
MPSPDTAAAPVAFDFTWRRYRINIATTPEEIALVHEIRHQVFYLEMLGRPGPNGTDKDEFDAQCDHLLIRDAATGAPIGTSRFASSRRCQRFYSQTEFAIDPFLGWDGGKMELGRTCFLPEHRNNLVIAAFGKSLGTYASESDSRWMFGCTSINTTDCAMAARLCRSFVEHDNCLPVEAANPLMASRLPGLDAMLAEDGPALSDAERNEILPPLLRGYLRAGAKISTLPSYDPAFACIDFFTTLDLDSSDAGFMRRYTK